MGKITEKQLKEGIDELLSKLNSKQRLVVTNRYGLNSKKSKTLEFIGEGLGISRERVRQIEQGAINSLRRSKKSKGLKKVFDFVEQELLDNGGFLDRQGFKEIIFAGELNTINRNKLAFLLSGSNKLRYQKDTVAFSGIWYLIKYKKEAERAKKFHGELVKYFRKNKEIKTVGELLNLITVDNFSPEMVKFFSEENKKNRLKIILGGSRILGKNIMNEWGLNSWAIISQKYAREKAFLILRKYKKPLHFRELTEYINKHWQDRRTLPQTVHNVIIKYDEFVFVQSGTYRLRD